MSLVGVLWLEFYMVFMKSYCHITSQYSQWNVKTIIRSARRWKAKTLLAVWLCPYTSKALDRSLWKSGKYAVKSVCLEKESWRLFKRKLNLHNLLARADIRKSSYINWGTTTLPGTLLSNTKQSLISLLTIIITIVIREIKRYLALSYGGATGSEICY